MATASIVDFLKGSGKDSSYSARSQLATQYGITGYTGSADQNTQLLQKLQTPVAPVAVSNPERTPAPVSAPSPIDVQSQTYAYNGVTYDVKTGQPVSNGASATNAMINGTQQNDYDIKSSMESPATREAGSAIDKLLEGLGSLRAPTMPSAADTYTTLLDQYDVGSLETDLSTLQNQQRGIEAEKRQRVQAQRDKPVAMGVIEGRVGEVERQENERLDVVNREIAYKSTQLQTKYNIVNTIMSLRQTDYQNAVQQYNDQFSKTVTLLNYMEGRQDRAIAAEDRAYQRTQDEKTNARADLQIIWNAAQESGTSFDALPATQKSMMAKLDANAGFPIGFSEFVTKTIPPNEEVLATLQSANGSEISMIVRDAAGNISTKIVKTGIVTKTSGSDVNPNSPSDYMTREEKFAAARQFITDNPNASPAELRSAIRENTGLEVGDTNTLIEEANVREASGFSDAQLQSAGVQLAKKLGVAGAKTYIDAGEITSGSKKYTLSRSEREKAKAQIDLAYPEGERSFWQKVLPGGK